MGRAVKRGLLVIITLILIHEIAWYNLAESIEVMGSWEYTRGPRRSCIDVFADGTYKNLIWNQGNLELQVTSKWTIEDNGKEVTFEKFRHLSRDGSSIKIADYWITRPFRSVIFSKTEIIISYDENLSYKRREAACDVVTY
jgi:hypothetical protein